MHFVLLVTKKLKNSTVGWVGGNEDLKPLIQDYFHDLFMSSMGTTSQELLNCVKVVVNPKMNAILMANYPREEVKKAMFQIGDMKALGPDGLHAIFFKRFWHILDEELIDEILDAIRRGRYQKGGIPQMWFSYLKWTTQRLSHDPELSVYVTLFIR